VDDKSIHQHISELVEQEHALRTALQAGDGSSQEERGKLREAEESLDQLWDLLRQRQAKRDAGLDPDEAGERPVSEVEGYRQ
jgi:DNA repair exonuclease SbcCD ATPase subunit